MARMYEISMLPSEGSSFSASKTLKIREGPLSVPLPIHIAPYRILSKLPGSVPGMEANSERINALN
ncbi:hypothetical protein ACE6H2_022313 [Prunus campanulata]